MFLFEKDVQLTKLKYDKARSALKILLFQQSMSLRTLKQLQSVRTSKNCGFSSESAPTITQGKTRCA